MLNHDPTGPIFEHGERMHLNRLKLAIKLRQKKVNTELCAQTIFNLNAGATEARNQTLFDVELLLMLALIDEVYNL